MRRTRWLWHHDAWHPSGSSTVVSTQDGRFRKIQELEAVFPGVWTVEPPTLDTTTVPGRVGRVVVER